MATTVTISVKQEGHSVFSVELNMTFIDDVEIIIYGVNRNDKRNHKKGNRTHV